LDEAQRAWERDAERSSLFREAMLLLSIDEWESGGRSELLRVAKAIVEQEEWEDSTERSALFDVCWNLAEQEEWEDSTERSALFDVCWNLAEQEDDEGLLLPPRWTRSELRLKAAGVAPLSSIVVEASQPSHTAAPASPEAQCRAAPNDCSGKTGKIWSPNNVASLFEAWSLPPSLDLGAS